MMATIQINGKHDLLRLRRHALHAQGLTRNAPFGRGAPGALKATEHLGYIQIDTISVVERAHHHVLRSRVPNFEPKMLNRLLAQRQIFEYWSHAAAFLPMRDFRFSLPYKHAQRAGDTHWVRSRDNKLMQQLLQRIAIDGPLRARDIEDTRNQRGQWWDWKPAKRALEQLFMQGDLMVSARDGFEKTYDLTERVLPAQISTQTPSTTEFAQYLLQQQLHCHGLVSLKGITYLRRDAGLRKAVQALVQQAQRNNELDRLVLNDGTTFFAPAGLMDRTKPRDTGHLRILSPFDNAVIQRDRLSALFGFDYQIECYVPAAKRKFGYFCLPLLYKDHFVGQLDCKAHRRDQVLEIKALHLEPGPYSRAQLLAATAQALPEFMTFQSCAALRVHDEVDSSTARELRTRTPT